ncbi:hypothetical protein SAMN05518671_2379 [Stenotrophomonas lactitubi]|nr:hypothetical protein SAMN04487863_3762 [Stenotrophomonas sp. yr243]SNT49057.1 hypothetical protein SAMN05518671_2379 [Stenotrophomonas lactitubi]
MSLANVRLLVGYAVAIWFGFALALYLLPLIETGSDFCRRGVHCDLPQLHLHSTASLGEESSAGSDVPDPLDHGARGRLPLLRASTIRGSSPFHPCRILY